MFVHYFNGTNNFVWMTLKEYLSCKSEYDKVAEQKGYYLKSITENRVIWLKKYWR